MILAATKRIYIYIRFVQYLPLQLLPAFGIALFVVKYFWLENEWEMVKTRISAPPKVTKYYKVFHRSARGEPDFGKQMLIFGKFG